VKENYPMFVYNNIGTSNELTDEDIVRMIQSGDNDKFGVLIDRYEAKMLRYARRFLFQAENAADLVQEVFIKAYSSIDGFDLKLKFSPWLYRIAHNRFINELNKKGRVTFFFDLDAFLPKVFSKDNADKDALDNELKAVLGGCMDKIDQKYREVVVLYFFDNFSYKEISDILHIPVSVVGIRLNRAKKIMKKLIKFQHGKEC